MILAFSEITLKTNTLNKFWKTLLAVAIENPKECSFIFGKINKLFFCKEMPKQVIFIEIHPPPLIKYASQLRVF